MLLNLLITELRRQDAIDKMKRFSSFEISRYKHIQGFQQFVKSLGIPGCILAFTQQGLEKLNDVITKNFFRSSCHHEEALKQLIDKQNRIEHLTDEGSKRAKKFEVECSNCSKRGHNRLTCTAPCQHCGQSYCYHLVDITGRKVPLCQQED